MQNGPYFACWLGACPHNQDELVRDSHHGEFSPSWFAPNVVRHTMTTELHRCSILQWNLIRFDGPTRGGATESYAKFDGAEISKTLNA